MNSSSLQAENSVLFGEARLKYTNRVQFVPIPRSVIGKAERNNQDDELKVAVTYITVG